MNIISSWKHSLQFLKPDHLKTFMLITLKTITDTYKSMNSPLPAGGNWFLAGILVLCISLTNIIKYLNLFGLQEVLINGTLFFIYFMFCLGMRSSVGVKDKEYFIAYLRSFWGLLVVTILLGLTPIFIIPLLFITYIFFLLFSFDTSGTMQGIMRAGRNSMVMVIYNLPIILLVYIGLSIINLVMYGLVAFSLGNWGGLTMVIIVYAVFVPIEIAVLSNVYIRRLNDQPELYFVQPLDKENA